MQKYYVYVYLDTRKKGNYIYDSFQFDYEPFYIGKGKGDRYRQHIRDVKKGIMHFNTYKSCKIRKIMQITGDEPIVLKVKEDLTEEEAFALEIELIASIGRTAYSLGPLTNATDGGEGASNPSPETRQKMSEVRKGEKNHFYGKRHTEETKKKIKETIKKNERVPWNKGIPRTEATKEKLRKPRPHMRGDNSPTKRPEVRKNISKSKMGEKNPQAKKWRLKHKEEIIEFSGGIKRFCIDNGFTYGKLMRGTVPDWELLN